MGIKFSATIDDQGHPRLDRPDLYSKHKAQFKPGDRVFVSLEKATKKTIRSNEQNAYYRGVVLRKYLCNYFGYSVDDMHSTMASMFLTIEPVPGLPITLSTTVLNTSQMEDYLAAIRHWASTEWNIWIPLPNEVDDVNDFDLTKTLENGGL